jgi:hypothetical protein
MKLVCIKNKFDKTNRARHNNDPLEVGKVYNTFKESEYYDDNRKLVSIYIYPEDLFSNLQYPKEWFIALQEYRENLINKIVNDE